MYFSCKYNTEFCFYHFGAALNQLHYISKCVAKDKQLFGSFFLKRNILMALCDFVRLLQFQPTGNKHEPAMRVLRVDSCIGSQCIFWHMLFQATEDSQLREDVQHCPYYDNGTTVFLLAAQSSRGKHSITQFYFATL